MNKTVLIFKHEFLLAIKRTGYIILTLTIPVLALLTIGIFKLTTTVKESPENNTVYIGYVDELGLANETVEEGRIRFVPYASKELANQALTSYKVWTYFIIPDDYLATGTVQRFTLENETGTSPGVVDLMKRFLSTNLLKNKVSPEVLNRVVSPLNLEVHRISDRGEQALEQQRFGNVIIPGVFALLLSLSLMFGAIALVNSLGEEKESRLIEVLFSSVAVRQLLISKVLALGLAGLLQVLVWLISAPLLLHLASSSFEGFMSGIEIPGHFLLLGTVYFILGYLLFAVLSIGVGAITPTAREGGQLSMFYVMLGFVPLWFSSLFFAYPNSTFSVILTLFPVTAPIQTMLRLGLTEVPLWQILASIGLLVLSIAGGLYLTIKIFRVYMLMHGKTPGLRTILRHFKSA
ncbi:MAG: ABC transporter permease [Bacteroidales bacterium]